MEAAESVKENGVYRTVENSTESSSVQCGDDKLEERYNKLKLIALKQKKRIAEQGEEIQSLQQEKEKLSEKSQKAKTIQQEFDKALDEIERLKKLEASLQKDLKSSIDDNVRLKELNSEDSVQIQNLTASHKILREKVEKLEKEALDSSEWKRKADEYEKELKEAKQNDMEAKQEKRQTAILSLEITDYEKKLQDAYLSLEDRKRESDRAIADSAEKDGIIQDLQETITDLNDNVEQLNRNKASLQADLQRKTEKITFLQDELSKLNDKYSAKKIELLKLETEYENTKLSFSSQSKELIEKGVVYQKTIGALEHKISVLEENRRSRESQIANLKLEMQQLETEYSNYKLKAQAMLKSQKPSMAPVQEQDELENLQRIVQDFHSEIALLKSDIYTMKLENENISMEKVELGLKLNQTKTDSIERDVFMNNEMQKLRQEMRQKDEYLKVQLDECRTAKEATLISYKTQIDALKLSYETQIRSLREQVELMKVVDESDFNPKNAQKENTNAIIIEQQPFRTVPGGPNSPYDQSSSHSAFQRLSHPLIIDTNSISFDQLRMIPRGECEGSESVGSVYTPRVDNYNISFEQLLSTSFDSVSKNSCDSEGEKPITDSVNLKEELTRSQSQINHLTSLLRESESNCERLTTLSEALKEEIRRIERESERKEHLKENTEYLKNVLLKFSTLNGEDERLRLIPVLRTMLRLTKEEVNRLECSVKGKSGQGLQKDGMGWSSYLPRWSGATDK